MVGSPYTNFSKIDDQNWAVFNTLSGAFDIVSPEEMKRLQNVTPLDSREEELWLARGYCFATEKDRREYLEKRYDEFKTQNESSDTQFILIPTYSCNFNCAYCYQRGIPQRDEFISREMIDAFIEDVTAYRSRTFRPVYVTLFGGEPLLGGRLARDRVSYLLEKLQKKAIDCAIVSNGYNLEEYVPLLRDKRIRELHITFDGDRKVHDTRRQFHGKERTFNKIFKGVEAAVEAELPVHIRLITDRETLPTFHQLSERFKKAGFYDLPKGKFKTSLGRNYDLIEHYHNPQDLFKLDEMYSEYIEEAKKHPEILKLHTPSFYGITKVIEDGEMFFPNFDSCPAGKTEFVYDATGTIYGCTASCGREGYELGMYYPEKKDYAKARAEWEERSVMTISECTECSMAFVCAGGCGVLAKEATGKVCNPNCKPVKEIMDTGIKWYRDRLLS